MAETDADRENLILDVLRRLARQRVAVLLQPGDVWMIEKALEYKEDVAEALLTCWMRGWVEPISNAVPHARVRDGKLPSNFPTQQDTQRPVYRLTDAGWNVIHRKHSLDVFACLIAVTSLFVSLASLVIAFVKT